jgi:mxaL protein
VRRAARWVAALRGRRDALLLGIAALSLAACFLRPGLPLERPQLELIVAIDITQSMNVLDAVPGGQPVSRLAHAKAALERALERMPCGSRLGWAIFTEYRSFLLLAPIEVCEHQRELREAVRRIDQRMAWSGNSEVAKGLNSGLQIAKALDSHPALVFVTDGQEAPPVNARYRPAFTVGRAEVRGLVVGVGGDTPMPIPKVDPSGRPLGEWGPDEVLQIDPRSLGRGGSITGEQMVETDERVVAPLPGATPGLEHLSSLREGYLKLLASETGLRYLRLRAATDLAAAFEREGLARPAPARIDLRPLLASLALLCLLWPALAQSGNALLGWLRGTLATAWPGAWRTEIALRVGSAPAASRSARSRPASD